MGKNKKNQSALGRAIIKDRFRGKNRTVSGKQNYLHTSELNDGYDWGRLNAQSVTEQSNLEDFLTTAELAGTEFTAEKLNIKFVDPGCNIGMLSSEEKQNVEEAQQKHRNLLQIPRRPPWTAKTSGEELETLERASFLTWRKQLATLQEEDHIVMTPFEKNLDFWRQLWRVIERSDVIVQIVDARNPLLFYCGDLQHYVSEVSESKVNLLLINKADHLSAKQREDWAVYFSKLGVRVAFWSALEETERQNEEALKEKNEAEDDIKDSNLISKIESIDDETQIVMENDTSDKDDSVLEKNIKIVNSLNIKDISDSTLNSADETESIHKNISEPETSGVNEPETSGVNEPETSGVNEPETSGVNEPETSGVTNCDNTCLYVKNSSEIMNGEDLLDVFRSMHIGPYHTENILTIGMVGYPNVGKSSSINAILRTKKVPVSATPGRTKHFQTLFVEPSLMLCDCPGLVFPSFVSTKAELVVNGILPVDQMRDHLSPINLICERIPRPVLELVYGINIRKPPEGDDPDRRPNAYELLNAYGAMRGYMTATGAPDGSRSSRYIIKDYINGKILYCHPPTGINSEDFQEAPVVKKSQVIVPLNLDKTEKKKPTTKPSSIDKDFFSKMYPVSHFKGVKGTVVPGRPDSCTPYGSSQSINIVGEKPWRHHNNRNKKEKLRRVYSHLDKHDYY